MNTIKVWEKRYSLGGNSGSGSYGILEKFKRNTINNFIEENNIINVLDIGCGDGNQVKLLNIKKYLGFDISQNIIQKCKNMYINDNSKKFIHYNGFDIDKKYTAELSMSLDVIYHLMEDDMFFKYLKNLFTLSSKYVIIYSINHGELGKPCNNYHIRERKFTDYVKNNFKNWELIKKIDQKYPKLSSAYFYFFCKK